MWLELFVRYFHFIGIIGVSSTLIAEGFIIKPSLPKRTISLLARIDAIYGISAIVTLAMGLIMWLWIGKPASFYNANPLFHTKLTLFVIIGILSIWPTLFFLKNRKGEHDEVVQIPRKIRNFVTIEIILLLCIPLLAVLMSRGVGL